MNQFYGLNQYICYSTIVVFTSKAVLYFVFYTLSKLLTIYEKKKSTKYKKYI